MSRIRPTALIIAAFIGSASLASLPAATAAGTEPVHYSTGEFIINCKADSTPQVCDPPEKLRVEVKGAKVHIKRLRYTAATTHCSAARVLISLDGDSIGHTDWVNAGEDSTVDHLKATLDRGTHRFAFRVKGRVGGCNTGVVGSWGGKIKLTGERPTRK